MTKSYKLITLILILISNEIRHAISPCSTYNDCSCSPSTPCCGHNGQCTITYINANQCILTTTKTTTTTSGIGINGPQVQPQQQKPLLKLLKPLLKQQQLLPQLQQRQQQSLS